MEGQVKLTIIEGPMEGQEFVFNEHDTFIFGRAPECHASLPNDSFISRYHFLVEIDPPDMCLVDLGSLNGTYLNDTRLGAKRTEAKKPAGTHARRWNLQDGDRIRAGETVFIVCLPGSAPTEALHCCLSCGQPYMPSGESVPRRPECESGSDPDPQAPLKSNRQSTVITEKLPDRIGPYKVQRELGRGSMGIVYVARESESDMTVALKVARPASAVDNQDHARFLREIALLRRLKHPYIVTLLDNGVESDTYFFAMEFCALGSVRHLLLKKGGRLPQELAMPIMRHVLRGLAYAHNRGFVHRDLKPENLLLYGTKKHWSVKIADFGLAKSFEAAGLSGMTATATCGGTYNYMPREQLTDFKYVRPVSDVWSMGAILYEMITGVLPRAMDNTEDPLAMVLNSPIIPVLERCPDCPPDLAAVMDRALAAEPDERYETARQFLEALKDVS